MLGWKRFCSLCHVCVVVRCKQLLTENQELQHKLENLARRQHDSQDEQKALKMALRRQEAGKSKAIQHEKMLFSKLVSQRLITQ